MLREEIIAEKRIIDSLRSKITNYSHLKELIERLSVCFSLAQTTKTLLKEVDLFFNDSSVEARLWLFNDAQGGDKIFFYSKEISARDYKLEEMDVFSQWEIKTLQPLLVEDVQNDFRFIAGNSVEQESFKIRSLISVPLILGDRTLGILRVDSEKEYCFTTEDLRFLTAIGDLSAVAIENAQLYEQVQDLAVKDGLTGLYLRRYLLDNLAKEVNRASKNNPLSFLMLDLDCFKQYNDKYGHMAGDIVLRTLSTILSDKFSNSNSLVCRYGGEEFCVLLMNCSKEEAKKLAEELREEIEQQTIILRREPTKITVSIGVSTLPGDAKNEDELIGRADKALYAAKESGRNKVCGA